MRNGQGGRTRLRKTCPLGGSAPRSRVRDSRVRSGGAAVGQAPPPREEAHAHSRAAAVVARGKNGRAAGAWRTRRERRREWDSEPSLKAGHPPAARDGAGNDTVASHVRRRGLSRQVSSFPNHSSPSRQLLLTVRKSQRRERTGCVPGRSADVEIAGRGGTYHKCSTVSIRRMYYAERWRRSSHADTQHTHKARQTNDPAADQPARRDRAGGAGEHSRRVRRVGIGGGGLASFGWGTQQDDESASRRSLGPLSSVVNWIDTAAAYGIRPLGAGRRGALQASARSSGRTSSPKQKLELDDGNGSRPAPASSANAI